MYEKLEPCPHCGEEDDISVRAKKIHGCTIELHGKKFWKVECLNCDAQTGYCFDDDAEIYGCKDGKEAAIRAWNMRTTDKTVSYTSIKLSEWIEKCENCLIYAKSEQKCVFPNVNYGDRKCLTFHCFARGID